MNVRARSALIAHATGAAIVLACLAHARVGRADGTDIEQADRLFREGKQRLAQSDHARACPLLAESFRLDPASGALLALALCHEREGRLASAAREYDEVAARSRQEGRPDRVEAAHAKARALQSRLSSLTIAGAAGRPGLEVRLDGAPVELDRLGTPLPVDGGDHVIEAAATGKQPWRAHVTVAPSMDARTITIPELQNADVVTPAPVAIAAPAPSAPELRSRSDAHPSLPRARSAAGGPSAEQWLGLGMIGAGVVGLGVGTYFAVSDDGESPDANAGCQDAGLCKLDDSDQRGAAALAFVVGGVLAATGTLIYLVSGPPSSVESVARTRTLAAAAWATPAAAGAAAQGRF